MTAAEEVIQEQNSEHKMSSTKKVYVGWQTCRIQDFVNVTGCFKSQGFGHTSKYCTEKEDTCGHCAEAGHGHK